MDWPFDDLAYAGMIEAIVDRFDTGDKRDLAHDSSNLMKANEEFHQLLVRGKRFTVTSEEGKETKRIFVRLVDLRDIENNRFVAADEFRVKRGGNSIRPDVNLFVNGIPLVTMELKSLAQENDYYDAIRPPRLRGGCLPAICPESLECCRRLNGVPLRCCRSILILLHAMEG